MTDSVSLDSAVSSGIGGGATGGATSTQAPSSGTTSAGTASNGPSVAPGGTTGSVQPQSPQESAQTVAEALKPPGSWKRDYHSYWEGIDPNLQKYLTEREQHFSRNASEWGNEKATLTGQLGEYRAAMYRYNDALSSGEVTEKDIINEWATFDRLLAENPQLAILNIAAQNGINLNELAQTNPMQHENMVLKARQSYPEWEGESAQIAQQQRFQQEYQSSIRALSEEVGEDGNPVRPYWNAIPEAQIRENAARAIEYYRQTEGQELDMRTALEVGYLLAESQNPAIKELKELRAAQQVEAEKAAAEAARRERSPRGVPGRAVPKRAISLDDAVEQGMSVTQKRY